MRSRCECVALYSMLGRRMHCSTILDTSSKADRRDILSVHDQKSWYRAPTSPICLWLDLMGHSPASPCPICNLLNGSELWLSGTLPGILPFVSYFYVWWWLFNENVESDATDLNTVQSKWVGEESSPTDSKHSVHQLSHFISEKKVNIKRFALLSTVSPLHFFFLQIWSDWGHTSYVLCPEMKVAENKKMCRYTETNSISLHAKAFPAEFYPLTTPTLPVLSQSAPLISLSHTKLSHLSFWRCGTFRLYVSIVIRWNENNVIDIGKFE